MAEQHSTEQDDKITRLTPDLVNKIKAKRESEAAAMEDERDLDLPIVAMTETLLGTLSDDERVLFIEATKAKSEVEALNVELTARFFERTGSLIREHGVSVAPPSTEQLAACHPSKEDALRYFELMAYAEMLVHTLMYNLGQRFGFGQKFGFRKGFKVVRTGYKYDQNMLK